MTAAQQLVQDPVNFIHQNVLIVTDPAIWEPQIADLDNQGRARLALVDMVANGYVGNAKRSKASKFFGRITGRGTQKPARGLYSVIMAPQSATDTFLAYICPYRADAARGMVLGGAANIMVTAELTGCSFGIGMAGGGGSRLVMHANASGQAVGTVGGAVDMKPQAKAQKQAIKAGLSSPKIWKPGQYRKVDDNNDIDVRSTVIGIRTQGSGNWHFYAQVYNADNSGTTPTRTMLNVVKIC